jgi:putative aldouronate transport system substrate-binding protein
MYKLKAVKLVSIIISISLMISVFLTGCGNQKEEVSGTTGTETGTTSTQTEEKLDPVNLTWCLINSEQKDLKTVQTEINEYLKEKLNVTLNLEVFDWGQYDQKMQLKIAGGEDFDLCFTTFNWVNKFQQNVTKGAFLPLDELLEKYGTNIKKTVPDKYINMSKVDGKIYAIPNYQITAMSKSIYFKKEFVDKYKFDYKSVAKMEDLEPYLEEILKNEKGITPINVNKIWEGEAYVYSKGYGVKIPDKVGPIEIHEDGNGGYTYSDQPSETYKNYLKLMRKWYLKGYIRKDAASIETDEPYMKAGKDAVMIGGTYKPGEEVEMSNKYGYPIVSQRITEPVVQPGASLAACTTISATSKNPERAMMLLDLVNSDKELFNKMIFGIKDKHYKMVDENTVEPIANSGYGLAAWELGNQFNSLYMKGQTPGTWEETIKYNEEAELSPMAKINFIFNTEPVKTEWAKLQAITDEFMPALTTGTVDTDEYLKLMYDKQKPIIPKLMEEVKKQVEEAAKNSK